MPRVSEFHGIVIQMFVREHGPPHFHAAYGGDRASVGLNPVAVLHGRLPLRARRMVLEWAELHRDELLENWDRARNRSVVRRIDPLP